MVILTFLLPVDASPVEYNTVVEDLPPILREEEGAGEAFFNLNFSPHQDASPVEYNTLDAELPPIPHEEGEVESSGNINFGYLKMLRLPNLTLFLKRPPLLYTDKMMGKGRYLVILTFLLP